jgi:murein DD-endopeptidase MepM/ murein hydrolase activator NlpD
MNKLPLAYPVLGDKYAFEDYCLIDLSDSNLELRQKALQGPTIIWDYIQSYCKKHKAIIAYGGYGESRDFYAQSLLFKTRDDSRNIHLGVDLWVRAGAPVFSPWEGIVYGFANNNNHLDYGPTIILYHPELKIYSLYGHLALHSLSNLYPGKRIKQAENFSSIGKTEENGSWAPHLHFQLILDIKEYKNDYPGVSNKTDAKYFLQNCPDPSRYSIGLPDYL